MYSSISKEGSFSQRPDSRIKSQSILYTIFRLFHSCFLKYSARQSQIAVCFSQPSQLFHKCRITLGFLRFLYPGQPGTRSKTQFRGSCLLTRVLLCLDSLSIILCIFSRWGVGLAKLITILIFSWLGFQQFIPGLRYLIHPCSHPKGAVFPKLELLLILCWRVIASENVLKKFLSRIFKMLFQI